MTRDEVIAANPLQRFLADRGYDLRPAGRNFVSSACPVTVHKKYHRPVSIDIQKQVWHCNDCKIGGTVIDWLMREKNVSAAEAMRMLSGGNNGSSKIVVTYDYTDEAGTLLFQCVRYQPKDFRQRQPDGKDGWIWNLQGVRRVLYRLPELLRGLKRGWPVIVTEGEKDADAIAKLGLPLAVTCNPLGAGKWRHEYSETLHGATVFVIADKDESGRKHAQQAAASLHGKTKSVAVIELPDSDVHNVKDASDWLAAGGTAGELAELLDAAQEWTPQTQTLAVDLAAALDSICNFLQRYVTFSSPAQPTAIALWIAHTWVLDAFDYSPYLHIHSPEKRCGKTRLLDCVELIVSKPCRAISPTEAVLFRKIEAHKPTLLLDEIDAVFFGGKDERKEPLRALLNAGFERGAKVPRCVGPNFEIKDFEVFCAKAFAGIGSLPDTVSDRCIPISLVRRSRDESVERFRKRDVESIVTRIRNVLAEWADKQEVIETLRSARPDLPRELSDRQSDICEPLLAIAELAGSDWPERARRVLLDLCVGESDEDESKGVKLLSAIREVFDATTEDRIATKEVLEQLVSQDTDAPWASWWEHDLNIGNVKGPGARLAKLLKPYRIKSRPFRSADGTMRGYMRDDFLDAWQRYCPPKTA